MLPTRDPLPPGLSYLSCEFEMLSQTGLGHLPARYKELAATITNVVCPPHHISPLVAALPLLPCIRRSLAPLGLRFGTVRFLGQPGGHQGPVWVLAQGAEKILDNAFFGWLGFGVSPHRDPKYPRAVGVGVPRV